MTKTEFNEIDKENEYISNMLADVMKIVEKWLREVKP